MVNIFGNLKLLKRDMDLKGWVIDSFKFNYNDEVFIVLVKLFLGNEKKIEKYALVKLEFLRQSNLNSSLELEANSNSLFVATQTLREYFNIEYNENLGDILHQFKQYFSKFIPTEVLEDKNEEQLRIIVASLSKSDSENPNKLYCYQVRRNGDNSNGNLAQRSLYNDNKTRILRPLLYSKLKDEKNISFCYSKNKNDENTNETILANWVKNKKMKE